MCSAICDDGDTPQSPLADLHSAGFDIEAVYGDWSNTPFDETARLMVFGGRAR